VAEMKMED